MTSFCTFSCLQPPQMVNTQHGPRINVVMSSRMAAASAGATGELDVSVDILTEELDRVMKEKAKLEGQLEVGGHRCHCHFYVIGRSTFCSMLLGKRGSFKYIDKKLQSFL